MSHATNLNFPSDTKLIFNINLSKLVFWKHFGFYFIFSFWMTLYVIMKYFCSICDELVPDNCDFVFCDYWSNWIHTQLSSKDFEALVNSDHETLWYCSDCSVTIFPFHSNLLIPTPLVILLILISMNTKLCSQNSMLLTITILITLTTTQWISWIPSIMNVMTFWLRINPKSFLFSLLFFIQA